MDASNDFQSSVPTGAYSIVNAALDEFVHAMNRSAPFTIDSGNRSASPKMFYAGCYVDAALETYAWESSNNKGVSVSLLGLRFAGDGEAFGAAPVSSSEFFPSPDDEDNPNNYNV